MFVTTKLWLMNSLILAVLKFQLVFSKEPHVPCFFIFGDSSVDSGNNNNLNTTAKGNFLPYGIDFPTGPTGRFSNGLTAVDYITQYLGFDEFVLTFAMARGSEILKGVNYGSGGAGILAETNAARNIISFDQQLINHMTTIARITLLQRNVQFTNNYLKKCLYAVQIGGNDYIGNFLLPNSTSSVLFTPETFAARLIRAYDRQLRTLYILGARKLAIFGAGPVGCFPLVQTNGTGCVDRINNIVEIFDDQVNILVQRLNGELPNAKFTFINTTSVTSGNRTAAGITVENLPCCQVSMSGPTLGICVPNGVACSSRDEYAFFDFIHYTEIVNKGIAKRSYIAQSVSDVHPVDISHLVDVY